MLNAIFAKYGSRTFWRTQNLANLALRSYTTMPTNESALTFQGTSLPYRWLRDSCQCPACVHPSTRQKLHRTSDIGFDIIPATDGVKFTDKGLDVEWATGHKSFYGTQFLNRHSSPTQLSHSHRDVSPISWDLSAISEAGDLFLIYESLQSPSGLLSAITQLSQYGLLFLTGVPANETSHHSCEVRTLAQRFGEIRTTMYGDIWDVINIRNSTNIAYTDLDLGLHMDLMYFEHPPRYQILHCVRNRVVGGTSVFVDALHAAKILRETNPEAFHVLATTPVSFHYENNGHHLHRSHTTIELDTTSGSSAESQTVKYINYSPPFQAPIPLSTTPSFYSALAEFASILAKPELTFQYLLREGDAVLFDNRRVLHARTAFKDKGEQSEEETNRWLQGCYFETDSFLDRGRVLRAEAEANKL